MKSQKSPSYKGLTPATELASRIKKRNSRSDTQPELLLRSGLWNCGLRFRKNVSTLPGRPDIVFAKKRLAIFCDGDFWHGRNWKILKRKLAEGTNATYWIPKIKGNINRDKINTRLLETEGWRVIRIWEGDIRKNLDAIVSEIETIVRKRTNTGV